MKSSVRLGLILLGVGALVFALGYFGSGGNLSAANGSLGPISVRLGNRGFGGSGGGNADDDSTYIERRAAYDAAELRRLVLREDNAEVRVTASPDEQIHLIWQESAYDPMEISDSGGTLTFDRKNKRPGILSFFFWNEDLHTELQVPENLAAALEVRSGNGGVTAEGLTLAGGAGFSSSNGAVTAKNLSLGDLTLENSNGSVRAEGIVCARAALKNSNGVIEAVRFACDSMEARTSNGKVTLTDVSAAASLYARTSNGAVEVMYISAGESVELHSSNGSVRGTLAGSADDYHIETRTGNGSSNLPGSWGRGSIRLTVETGNGSIELKFAED